MLDRNRQYQVRVAQGYSLHGDAVYEGTQYFSPYETYREQTEPAFNPLGLLIYVVRYRWLIAILTVAGIVGAFAFTLIQTPRYEAATQLEVLVPSAKVFQDLEVVSESADIRAFLTAREKIRSRAIAQRVVFQLGLADNPAFLTPTPDFAFTNILYRAFGMKMMTSTEGWTAEEREAVAVGRVLSDMDVQLMPNTSLLTITFRDQDPKIASDVSNQIARSFIEQRVDQTSETSELARQFIQEQVLQVKEKLQSSEEALVQYAKQSGITVTGEDKSLIAANIEAMNTALAAAIQERLDYARLVTQIDAGQGASLQQVLESEAISNLRSKVAELSAEYQQKLSLFKPGFPEMRQLQAQATELKRQISGGVEAITDSIKLKHAETVEKEQNLREKLSELEAQQIEFNDKNIRYTILKREVDSNRAQYDGLIAKLNDVGVSSELRAQNAAIVDFAVPPATPYSPRLKINLAIGLALSLLLCGVIAYIRELLNNTFSATEQIENELGLSVLGILPKVDDREFATSIADMKSGLSEAYRTLRTSLQFSGAEGAPKTLLVTSAEPAEGKTTTAFKLGQDFAALGSRVLIIDADMRKPGIHRLFGLDNVLGLSNLLTNTVPEGEIASLFKSTSYDKLFVLTSGTIPPNPADLLSSPKMAVMVSSLLKRFDMIIIDAPPIVGLSDAPILSRLTEGTLLVVSAHQVTRKSAKASLKRVRGIGSNLVGAAFTKFSVHKYDYNYSHNYMQHRYYGYGNEAVGLEQPSAKVKLAGSEGNEKRGNLVDRLRSVVSERIGRIKSAV